MTHECSQVDRLERIEADVVNHRMWRNNTTIQLTNIEVSLATINERLKTQCEAVKRLVDLPEKVASLEKEDGKRGAFRITLILTVIGLIASVVTAVFAYGGLNKQVEINTDRWHQLMTVDHKDIK